MSQISRSDVMARINAVSPSFCLAKWLQVTIDLVHGTNHSCHHPKRHRIPLDELAANPSALHNTAFKKSQRKLMLEGARPPECGYCWDLEDAGIAYSDRIIKSTDPWAFGELEKVRSLPWDSDVAPTYVEIMLDDLCNFSCMYCMADVSSSVAYEMKRFGPYPVKNADHRMPLEPKPGIENPYLAAFWRWLPEILPGLKVLRVTGGEPLLSREFDRLLSQLEGAKHPDLTLALNSHLGHDRARLEAVFGRIQKMIEHGNIGSFELYTSVDAKGSHAEYVRHGLDYSRLMRNIELASGSFPGSRIVLMCTFNILSIASFRELLEDVIELKKSCPGVVLDTSYLRNPMYLRADMADRGLKQRLLGVLEWLRGPAHGFNAHELGKIENVVSWICRDTDTVEDQQNRRDFFKFVNEYDRRKGKSFLEIFPEYRDFYILCKQALFESRFQPNV